MIDDEKKADTVEQIEERLEKKREARAVAERVQYAIDLQARETLEDEHGKVAGVKVVFRQGLPTHAYVRPPQPAEYKRYKDLVQRALSRKDVKGQAEAGERLGRDCWVYPSEQEAQDQMLEAFPGLLVTMSIAAQALAEGKAVEEGKG